VNPRNRILCLAVPAICGILSACTETRFESPPGDNIETCDAHWKGVWNGEDAKPSDATATLFFVDEGCRFTVLEQTEKGGPFKQIHVPVNYVHADGKNYLVVADNALKGLVELKPIYGVDPVPEKTFFFARYEAHADRIDVYSVDDKRVANQVIDGKLDGTVSRTSNELHVFVHGDRARTLEILRHGSIFQDKSNLQLVRIKQSAEDYQRLLIESQRKKKP
jgi:hypothetical protein